MPWTKRDVERLRSLANGKIPARLIAYYLGRTERSVRQKAYEQKISLKPMSQRPYNRREKG
jgi:hypothetical protein